MASTSTSNSNAGRPRVTASRIAREVGVSPATVSLVLNQRGDDLRIAPETQQRILDAARRLNYIPNYLARGLTGASVRSIGLLWPLGGAPGNVDVAYRLIQGLDQRGHMAFLTDALSSPDYTERCLNELAARCVDGIIVYAGGTAWSDDTVRRAVEQFRVAVVIAARPIEVDADFILHDRRAAMRQIAHHFVDTGRHRAAILTAGDRNPTKIEGFLDALAQRGVDAPRDAALIQAPYHGDRDLVATAMAHLDRQYPGAFPFQAVACTDDDLAVGLIAWLRQRGLRVPEDVAVTGFNDVRTSRYLLPPLASVDRRDEEVADLAERLLFERLADRAAPRRAHDVAMHFIWRDSAGGPPPTDAADLDTSRSSNRKGT